MMLNELQGELDGYNCDKCNNRGYFAYEENGYTFTRECDCMKMRKLINLASFSGMGELLKKCTFSRYEHKEKWQDDIYNKALHFINDTANCFYIGGQSGAGKTHICTAMVRELIKQGIDCQYVLWENLNIELKQSKYNDAEQYNAKIKVLTNASVLYIDEILKSKDNNPTSADIDNMYNIINARYILSKSNNKRYITIISSLKTLEEILQIDESTGSRLYEMANKKYIIGIDNNSAKNYRQKI